MWPSLVQGMPTQVEQKRDEAGAGDADGFVTCVSFSASLQKTHQVTAMAQFCSYRPRRRLGRVEGSGGGQSAVGFVNCRRGQRRGAAVEAEKGRETEDAAKGTFDSLRLEAEDVEETRCRRQRAFNWLRLRQRAFNCLQMASIGAQDERGRETEDTAEGYDSHPFCMFF
ncbi:hypothetical protein LXL04_017632 [Taraxacum kok-saghyz]